MGRLSAAIGSVIGEWKIVDVEESESRAGPIYKIECTECGEVIGSRWNKFGAAHPRLCTCHPEYRGRGRPRRGEAVVPRPKPELPENLRYVPPLVYRPDTEGRRRLADEAMLRPPIMPHQAVLDRKMSDMRTRAVEVGMDFSLTREFLEALFVHQTGFCAISGMPITLSEPDVTASLDRKDSRYGYVPGNVQWTHKAINRMKLDTDQDRFVEMCAAVASSACTHASEGPEKIGE